MDDNYSAGDVLASGADDRWGHLIGHIQDAVVEFELVEGEPIVRSVNDSFVEVFAYDRDDVLNAPLNEYIVPEWLAQEATALDARTSSGEVNYQRVRRLTGEGLRDFLYRGIPYNGDDARIDGFAVYTDLTDLNQHERQLQVLNRILRHNLRNKANVIAGNTTRLLDEFEEQTTDRTRTAATIETAARDLERLAQEASTIRRVLNGPDAGVAPVDCVPIIQQLVREYRRTAPNASIEADLPESVVVNAAGGLHVAIDSLLDNAITHNPAATPHVRVRLAPAETGRWIDICIDDDGPRIPLVERHVITGHAEITQTQHGHGLGLWLVKWATEQSGGELSFERSDLGGNSVRLRLKRQE